MADIDDELLALAGESSDEEVMSGRDSRGGSASPPPANKGGARKTGARKGSRREQGESEEEEGEAFSAPGSPDSMGSAAMDESDSDAEAPRRPSVEPDDDEKYPVDGMFVSHVEKEHIMGLREVERESILADRTTEIERQRQNRMLRQLVSKQENEEKKAMKVRKRTATSADLDEDEADGRKSSRQRTEMSKTSSGIDKLRRARAEKDDRARARLENRHMDRMSPRRDRRGSSVASRDSFDDRGRSLTPEKPSEPRELPPPTLRDFERIRVGRSRFAEYCFNPGVEEALTGCFVRVSLGPDEAGVDQYRMAKIQRFTSGKPYAMTGPGGSFVTDQYVHALHGASDRDFAFIFCSDKPFTEREFNRYVTVLQHEGIPMPKTQSLLNKIDDINRFIGRSLTNEEIGEKVERKRTLRHKFDPERRERLGRELDEAKAAGKEARAQEIRDELDDLQTSRLAFRTTLSPQKSASAAKGTAQQDRLAEINKERRRQNAANVGKAQLKEKLEARRREKALERGEATDLDMSRRIRTKAKFVHDAKNGDGDKAGSRQSTPANGTPRMGPQHKGKDGEALPHLAKALENARKGGETKKGAIHRPICDDDIIGEIDLELDVDFD